jgi:hypothetical protein
MSCQRCKSERTAHVSGKTSDMCSVQVGEKDSNDYVPRDMNIGGGDYVSFSYCLDCGQMQGTWPLNYPCNLEEIDDSESYEAE